MQDLNPAYNMLLRSELLGCQLTAPISPDKATQLEQLRGAGSPAKKILRFKSGDAHSPVAGPPPGSPFLSSPAGLEGLLGSPMSPRRAPRKIPRAPYKVSTGLHVWQYAVIFNITAGCFCRHVV